MSNHGSVPLRMRSSSPSADRSALWAELSQTARLYRLEAPSAASSSSSAARTDLAQTAARPKGPDPDTDLLTALLKRSKTSDPAPSAQATAATADCKPGAPCKP